LFTAVPRLTFVLWSIIYKSFLLSQRSHNARGDRYALYKIWRPPVRNRRPFCFLISLTWQYEN
jgi:hypothetical protein